MSKRILIVDDEPELLKVLGLLLRRQGFEVKTALDGVEALEQLDQGAFDGMILGLIMPRMYGVEVLRRLRQTNQRMPVLIISGGYNYLEENDLKFLRLNAQALLPKPCSSDELKQVVDRWFGPPC